MNSRPWYLKLQTEPAPDSSGKIKSEATLISERQIGGYVTDPSDPDRRFIVELFLDGFPTQIGRASLYDSKLRDAGFGDGCYRFIFTIAAEALAAARYAEVRLANMNEIVGAPIVLGDPASGAGARSGEGHVRWIGGLRFAGWFDEPSAAIRSARAFIDAELVAETKTTEWRHDGDGPEGIAAPAFDLYVPSRFADGRVRQLRVIDDSGSEMTGSPCTFVAFENGLSRALEGFTEIESERLRGKLFDRLVPRSAPFASYEEWTAAFPPPQITPDRPCKVAVALIGELGLDASIGSLEGQTGCDWIAGMIPEDEGQTTFRGEDMRQFLETDAADCDIVVFTLSGASFHAGALNHLADALAAFPAAPLVYCDVAVASENEKEWPVAFPAFDYERMLEQGYGAYFFATRISYARDAIARGAQDLFRLFNMAVDGPVMADRSQRDTETCPLPVHAPGFFARIPRPDLRDGPMVLAKATESHLRTRGVSAVSSPGFGALFPAARVMRRRQEKTVSILIPTRNRVDLLKPCVESLQRTLDFDQLELIVIDNDTSCPDTLAYFASLAAEIRIVSVRGPFNLSRILWAGASIATGEFILLLSNDIEAIKEGWLDEMLSRLAESNVGAVGATLLRPSGGVHHSGIVLGCNFAVREAFSERMDGDPGYTDLLLVAHQCSAIAAACLLTPRRLFNEVAGFDGDRFPVDFSDVDFCLRLRARGHRIVVTPHARLLKHGPGRGRSENLGEEARSRAERELRNLRSAWGETLMSDPYYNPLLSLDEKPYSALAWPPRETAPRQPLQKPPNPIPPGF